MQKARKVDGAEHAQSLEEILIRRVELERYSHTAEKRQCPRNDRKRLPHPSRPLIYLAVPHFNKLCLLVRKTAWVIEYNRTPSVLGHELRKVYCTLNVVEHCAVRISPSLFFLNRKLETSV
ncbi:hypothetical protein SS1G_10568 [Sclerotinia sclerotiorum 1980 UF-70]|uniref:Uncharacterized protein n=1 Tax=Sclerotinia sclerotiorum (strain ATCC 18683 / 1980 / Ss-1) TaxID=665079 RepID=A7EZ02_SCLS1|nr:hypothetical protein SS1G_10568 [Sclerotinia sclerotiorum 1980 UF-70]EDN94694.1 hypothetical protein SS1G_10568 [Sclerotinia sclerotiorum 1980 UF-70]